MKAQGVTSCRVDLGGEPWNRTGGEETSERPPASPSEWIPPPQGQQTTEGNLGMFLQPSLSLYDSLQCVLVVAESVVSIRL